MSLLRFVAKVCALSLFVNFASARDLGPVRAPTVRQRRPAFTAEDCSGTSLTSADLYRCVQAVRVNPATFGWFLEERTRKGGSACSAPQATAALVPHTGLTAAAVDNVQTLAATRDLHGEAVARIGFPTTDLRAWGFSSALDLALEWMCSPSHRAALTSCDYDVVGAGVHENAVTLDKYAVVVLGCARPPCACGKT